MGHDTLSQYLGPLHRLQRCGSVDRQCHFEILCDSIKIVIETSEMARHIGFVQCRYSTQAREGKRGARCAESKTLAQGGVRGRNRTLKGSSTREPP